MVWSIRATGDKEQCRSQLEAAKHTIEGDAEAQEHDAAKALLLKELARYGEGATDLSVAAFGELPGTIGGTRILSIWISGKATPVITKTKAVSAAASASESHAADAPSGKSKSK